MIRTSMHGDEVNYITQPDAVSQVPENSGQQKRARSQDAVVVSWGAKEKIKDCHRSRDRQSHEKPACKASAILQLAKRDPRILCIDQVKEAVDNSSVIAE